MATRDLVEGRDLPPDQLGKVQPTWWPSSCPDDYGRFWQAVQASVHALLEAGTPADWPPRADERVVIQK